MSPHQITKKHAEKDDFTLTNCMQSTCLLVKIHSIKLLSKNYPELHAMKNYTERAKLAGISYKLLYYVGDRFKTCLSAACVAYWRNWDKQNIVHTLFHQVQWILRNNQSRIKELVVEVKNHSQIKQWNIFNFIMKVKCLSNNKSFASVL